MYVIRIKSNIKELLLQKELEGEELGIKRTNIWYGKVGGEGMYCIYIKGSKDKTTLVAQYGIVLCIISRIWEPPNLIKMREILLICWVDFYTRRVIRIRTQKIRFAYYIKEELCKQWYRKKKSDRNLKCLVLFEKKKETNKWFYSWKHNHLA